MDYKRLSYTVQNVEFGDIERVCRENNLPPTGTHPDGSPYFTLPAIIDRTGSPAVEPRRISDSLKIMEYLDVTYLDSDKPIFPSIHDGVGFTSIHVLASSKFGDALYPSLRPLIMEKVYEVQTEKSKEPWRTRHETLYKRTLAELGAGPAGSDSREKAWAEAEKMFEDVGKSMDVHEHDDNQRFTALGPVIGRLVRAYQGHRWLMGDKPTYADFVLVSFLGMVKLVDPEDGWVRISSWSGGRWGRNVAEMEKLLR